MTDQELLNQVQYGLMEPPDNGATWPSGLWTVDEVLAALNERQNRLLKSTRFQVGLADITTLVGVARYALPQDWLTTVAVDWTSEDGTVHNGLERSDLFEADHGMPTWNLDRATPQLYMDEDPPLLQIQIAPVPEVNGTLRLLYVPQGAPLDGTGELITLSDEYAAPVLKYGLYADLLAKDGRGANPQKALYCELRYQLGIEMAGILLRGWV